MTRRVQYSVVYYTGFNGVLENVIILSDNSVEKALILDSVENVLRLSV